MALIPHRFAQHAPTAADTSLAVGASLAAAILADTFSEVNLLLAWLCVWAFLADFAAGFTRMLVCDGLGGYSGKKALKGAGKKVSMVLLWVAAGLADAGVATAGLESFSAYTPTLKLVLLITLLSEVVSIARNAGEAAGRQQIAAVILQAIRTAAEIRPGVKVGESDHTHVVVIEDEPEEEKEEVGP